MINGVIADFIDINDRAIHYGDGLFETLLCSNKKLYYWQAHYQRLKNSAQKLDIRCPEEKVLLEEIARLVEHEEETSDDSFAIKIILSRGAGERGYAFSKKISANRLIMLAPVRVDYSSLLSEDLLSGDLYLCESQVSINTSLAGIKHLNRLENVLARNEWQNTSRKHYIDGVMLNANQHVIECTSSNIFGVKDGHLITPDLQLSGVDGIMRNEIIRLAADINLDTAIRNIELDELLAMDELFITNSLIGLKSINSLEGTLYRNPEVTKLIFDRLMRTKENHVQNIQ